MTSVKFVDQLPEVGGLGRNAMVAALRQLRERPGQWAEVARYEKGRRGTAHSRGHGLAVRHDDLEYAVRDLDGMVVLYLRAVSP